MKRKTWLLILLAALGAAALWLLVLRPGFAPGPLDRTAIDRALADDAKKHGVVTEFRIDADTRDLSVHEGLDENWTHILLMGTDGLYTRLNDGRSDSMLVASLNKATNEIRLTSLVRDMLITLPDSRSEQRINTANAFGGPYLAVKTVNELLELNITRYCSINFTGFSELIDLMGGVEMALSQGEAKIVGVPHREEPQLLNGGQALTYARIRKLDNNFGRNERQRKLLEALLQKALGMKPEELLKLVPEALKLVSTNLTGSEVVSLLQLALANRTGVDMLSLPPDKTYHYGRQNGTASVIIFNEEKTRRAFWEFIAGTAAEEADH